MNDDKMKAPYNCKFCGAPSWIEPSDQDLPKDYCRELTTAVRNTLKKFAAESSV